MKEIIMPYGASIIETYRQIRGPMLMETLGKNKYEPLNVAVATAALEVKGDEQGYKITPLTKVGKALVDKYNLTSENTNTPTKGIRKVLNRVQLIHPLMGLYGAFAYDMVREIANIGQRFWQWREI